MKVVKKKKKKRLGSEKKVTVGTINGEGRGFLRRFFNMKVISKFVRKKVLEKEREFYLFPEREEVSI